MIISEDIICQDLKECIMQSVAFIKDNDKKELYTELAKNIDYSAALSYLSQEVSDAISSSSSSYEDS